MSHGPYQTHEQASADTRPIYDARHAPGGMTGAAEDLLADTCRAAGVQVGLFDEQHLAWLARASDPETVVVIAGLIHRAFDAGRRTGGDRA